MPVRNVAWAFAKKHALAGWSKTVVGVSMNFAEALYSVTVISVAKIGV
jgi:hypothetical protein